MPLLVAGQPRSKLQQAVGISRREASEVPCSLGDERLSALEARRQLIELQARCGRPQSQQRSQGRTHQRSAPHVLSPPPEVATARPPSLAVNDQASYFSLGSTSIRLP